MKTIEEIENEYKEFVPVSNFVDSLEEFNAFIDVGILDTIEQREELKEEIRVNKKEEIKTQIINLFSILFNTVYYIDLYQKDNELIYEIIDLIDSYKNNFIRIKREACEDNYKELVKLIDFSCVYFNNHIDYYDDKRATLEFELKGIGYSNCKYENNIKVFQEFFDKKINELCKKQEKIKKID
jgi:flagellin-specific chaperone FliS